MKNLVLKTFALAACLAVCASCSDDDEEIVPVIDPVGPSSLVGAYVLNEGNYYSGINGSLSFIDYGEATITNNLFYARNTRSLGGTPNAIVADEAAGELYIACTDENRVEVTDMEANSVAWIAVDRPREMVVADGFVYVTSYGGTVVKISTATHAIAAESDVAGSYLEGIAVRGGSLYVCNAYNADYTYNTNVIKMDAETLVKTGDVEVACNPTDIKLMGSDLYLLSTGNYYDVPSQLQKIDSADNVSYVCDATLFDAADGKLYVVNAVTDWATYESSVAYSMYDEAGTQKAIVPPVEIASPCAIAADPVAGKIFISSYVTGAYGYADYAADGYVAVFDEADPTNYAVYWAGVGPTNILFTE